MKVFGIAMVRDEVDIIRLMLIHHLSLGFDSLIIVDNGSSDGTDDVLRMFRHDKRVQWTRDESPFHESEIVSDLAREAFSKGADWVAPLAADEFWYAGGRDFRHILAESTAGALKVQAITFIQSRKQLLPSPVALLTMTRRIKEPIGPPERCQELVESKQISIVEMMFPPRWVARATPEITFFDGCHGVSGVDGDLEDCGSIVILHATLRSRAVLDKKVEHAWRHDEAGAPQGHGWHVRRLARLQAQGALDDEWAANSYSGGFLDVYGNRHAVVWDPRLCEQVTPIIRSLAG